MTLVLFVVTRVKRDRFVPERAQHLHAAAVVPYSSSDRPSVNSAFWYSGAYENVAKRGDSTTRNRRVVATCGLPVSKISRALT